MKPSKLFRPLLFLSLGITTLPACGDDSGGGDAADTDDASASADAGGEAGDPPWATDGGDDGDGDDDSTGGDDGGDDDSTGGSDAEEDLWPGPGDLIISELMIDLEGDDAGREWFEIQNISDHAVLIDGLTLLDEGDDTSTDVVAPDRMLEPGERLVLAESPDAALPEGTDIVFYGDDIGLDNGDGGLAILAGDTMVDAVSWDRHDGWPVVQDSAMSLDIAAMTTEDNNYRQSWCSTSNPTPGAENPTCGEGSSKPLVGAIIISELMPRPEDGPEWIELENTSRNTVRLHGLEIAIDDVVLPIFDGGLEMGPGERLVIASSGGEIAAGVLGYELAGLELKGKGRVELRFAEDVLDAVDYDEDDGWLVLSGRSVSVDPSHASRDGNDDRLHWCAGAPGTPGAMNDACAYGDEVPFPEPGDLQITEIMVDAPGDDQGKEWLEVYNAGAGAVRLDALRVSTLDDDATVGEVGVALQPGAYAVLAQDAAMFEGLPAELATGAYGDGLALSNDADMLAIGLGASVLTSIAYDSEGAWPFESGASLMLTATEVGGDNHTVLASWCTAETSTTLFDDAVFATPGAANTTCVQDLAPAPSPGELVISEFMSKVPGDDGGHEWIEIHNTADGARRLNGLTLRVGGDEHEIDLVGLEVPAGGYALIAQDEAYAAEFGGAAAYYYGNGVDLPNEGGTIELLSGETVIDAVAYDELDAMWTLTSGYSTSLHPTDLDASINDDGLRWCLGWTTIGETGLRGTPGEANEACPLRAGEASDFIEDPSVYDQDVLEPIVLELTVDPAHLAEMEAVFTLEEKDALEPFPAAFSSPDAPIDGSTPNATISLRGQTSIASLQKSWKVKLDEGDFRGQTTVHLSKHTYDVTRIRQQLAARAFRGVGHMPSLRTQFVQLYINGIDYGLYNQIEHLDERFLRSRHFDERGALFKANLFSFWPASADEMAAGVVDGLEAKTVDDFSGVFAMLESLYDAGNTWDDIVAAHFDRDNLIDYFASTYLIKNLDTTWQNYYLYASPHEPERFYFIPWDFDGAWDWYAQDPRETAGWRDGLGNWWDQGLFRRMLQDESFVNDIAARVQELTAGELAESNIQAIVDELEDIARPYQYAAPDANSGNQPQAIDWRDDVVAALAGVPEARAQELTDTLERPMPFTTVITDIGAGDFLFTWDPAYDIQGDDVEYDIIIATGGCGWLQHDCFDDGVLLSIEGLTGTSTVLNRDTDLGSLPAGEYQFLMYAHDTEGASQVCYQHNLPRTFFLD
ncbi:MAG: CotH kinase family protein [Myxococcota bacterium]